jgi:hypothetical protein
MFITGRCTRRGAALQRERGWVRESDRLQRVRCRLPTVFSTRCHSRMTMAYDDLRH